MNQSIRFAIFASLLTASLHAAAVTAAADTIVASPADGRVVAVRLAKTASATSSGRKRDAKSEGRRALRAVAKSFKIQDPDTVLDLGSSSHDDLGMTHLRYSQLRGGVPIYGAQLSVHLDKTGDATLVQGSASVAGDAGISTARIDEAAATAAAQQDWTDRFGAGGAVQGGPKLFVYDPAIFGRPFSSEPFLVWEVVLYHRAPTVAHEAVLVHAQDGSIVERISKRSHAVKRIILDCDPGFPCFADFKPNNSSYTFGRSEGKPARGQHPTYGNFDTDVVYESLGAIHDYYFARTGRDGANEAGGIGDGFNASLDSTPGFVNIDAVSQDCPNAFFDGFSLNFCVNVTGLDVSAHEYQHAVTQYAVRDSSGNPAGLLYMGESGALNEAYSDIFGELAEQRITGTNDFLIGPDINSPPLVGPLRDMADPESLGQPAKFSSTLVECDQNVDNGGVHINSGIVNKAAQLLMVGGDFNGRTITAIGYDRTEALFYRALTTYLTPTSGFNSAVVMLQQSCTDLGYGPIICGEVTEALQAVEMDQAGACSGSREPVGGSPVNLTIEARLKKRTEKRSVTIVSGVVLDIVGNPVPGVSVLLTCQSASSVISGNLTSNPSGLYGGKVTLKTRGMRFCQATSGTAASQFVKVLGAKVRRGKRR